MLQEMHSLQNWLEEVPTRGMYYPLLGFASHTTLSPSPGDWQGTPQASGMVVSTSSISSPQPTITHKPPPLQAQATLHC